MSKECVMEWKYRRNNGYVDRTHISFFLSFFNFYDIYDNMRDRQIDRYENYCGFEREKDFAIKTCIYDCINVCFTGEL
jgi:hypothetical protein